MLVNDRLVVKLPRSRVDELVAAGEGDRFDPGHGRIQKEWLSANLGFCRRVAGAGNRGRELRERPWLVQGKQTRASPTPAG